MPPANVRRSLAKLDAPTGKDSLSIAREMVERNIIEMANRFGRTEMVIILFGGFLVMAGGALELVERLHWHSLVCKLFQP